MHPPVAIFIQHLSPTDQANLTARMKPWKAQAEEVLFKVGQHMPGLWMLDKGLVRYEVIAPDGQVVVPAFSSGGGCFGELEVLEQREANVTAITSTPCEGWVMSATAALDAIETVPAFSKLIFLKLARNVRLLLQLHQMSLMLGQHQRLALALLNLAQPAAPGPDGQSPMVVSVTQETLCRVTGNSRQMVSKYLRQWTDLGWVVPRYRSLEILDMAGLKSIFPPGVDPEIFLLLNRHTRPLIDPRPGHQS